MDPYILLLVGAGALVLLVAWLPMLLKELPLSLPIFCIGIGFAVFSISNGEQPDPLRHPVITEKLTEAVVIIALTGAGLKLDRPFSFGRWALTWRLLLIAMPLSIAGIAALGWGMLGFSLGAAVLLGAALAPTDPVLASDVQVGPPKEGEEDEVRFTLTAEAGLNDGLAFPFVHLAIALATYGLAVGEWGWEWIGIKVVWKLAAGVGMGVAVGWALGWVLFHLPNRAKLSRTGDGFVAIGVTLLAYGLTEMVQGYGFLAVFVAALCIRAAERENKYHQTLHDFAEEMERLLMMVILVLFGGALAGGLLDHLTWTGAGAVLLFIFLVRPLAGMASLAGLRQHPVRERAAIAFFGIRGLGSFYYLAYALNHASFPEAEALWSVLGFTVLVSVLLHGTTVTPAMRHLDSRRQAAEAAA